MVTGNTPPVEQARSIFDDLGYTVTGEDEEFTAARKWRSVRVTPTADGGTPGDDPNEPYRCFVTWQDEGTELRRRLDGSDPGYEWAIIEVTDAGDYEVLRDPAR
ncbi:hypothetical protein BRC81_15780 [Halobacteriales archaeon QS_1_68_20]|nr:MAG: hypothetical protein BRC81_15780 [Halobacteriales archaeon QS_1_68_20]